MCGIAGIYSRNTSILSKIQKMTEIQKHRGPDGSGHLLVGASIRREALVAPPTQDGDFLALGHRRLAILDCTSAGSQPMASHDRLDWISYNGEVYNYLELRQELESLGFDFYTGTDTEVVLAAYRAWGVHCFERFNGMWALAIWDGVKRQLILSRDRFGVKPLYFAKTGGTLLFASELKAILCCDLIKPKLNIKIAIDYLKWSMVNHSNDTFFDGIQSFPAGHYVVLNSLDRLDFVAKPFWKLETSEHSKPISMDEATKHFSKLFNDAVAIRLRSDVPVGSCLSGGLDSSGIVCQADRLRQPDSEPIHTFNSASKDPRFDERLWCKLVNDKIGAKAHYEFPTNGEFVSELDALIWHQEEPFTTASIYAQWRVMKAARSESIPVLLDGQGADEALCGYRKFYMFYLRELICHGSISLLISEIAGLIKHGDRGLLRLREGVRYLPSFMQKKVPQSSMFLNSTLQSDWTKSALPIVGGSSISERQIADLLRFSVPSLLRYEDKNSMAWSVESRVPFLDYRLVEWLVNAPTSIKLNKGRTKSVLRNALRGMVPDTVVDRRDKMGFVTGQEVWMKDGLRPILESCFGEPDSPLGSIMNTTDILSEYRLWLDGGSSISHNEFFKLFILARWMKSFDVKC